MCVVITLDMSNLICAEDGERIVPGGESGPLQPPTTQCSRPTAQSPTVPVDLQKPGMTIPPNWPPIEIYAVRVNRYKQATRTCCQEQVIDNVTFPVTVQLSQGTYSLVTEGIDSHGIRRTLGNNIIRVGHQGKF